MKYSLLCFVTVLVISTFLVVDAKKKPANNKFEGDFEFVDEDDKTNPQKSQSLSERKKWIHDPSNDLCKPLNCKKKELCLLEDAFTAVCVSKKELHRNKDEVLTRNKFLEEEARRKAESVERGENNFPTPPQQQQQQQQPPTIQQQQQQQPLQDSTTEKESKPVSNDSHQDDDVFYDSDSEQYEDNCKPCPPEKPTFLCGSDNTTYSSLCRLDYHNCLQAAQIKVSCKGFCPCRDPQIEMRKQQRMMERANEFNAKYQKTIESSTSADNFANKKKEDRNRRYNRINSQFTFTPEEIKYDNKHYKYMKFTNGNSKALKDGALTEPEQTRNDRHKMRAYNEVLDKQPTSKTSKNGNKFPTKSTECKPQQLIAIGNRLIDWFSVIMADSKKRRQHTQKSKVRFPAACKAESRWMFGHLDLNFDGYLSLQELYELEHDQNEKCIKPFIDACDLDQNSVTDAREWCRCFEKTERPCAAVKRRLNSDMMSSYSPECDQQGFYKSTQCHHAVGVCWCVDKHGVEYANTRTRNNKPNCDEVISNAASSVTSDDEDDETDDDSVEGGEDGEGSADRLLVF